MRLENVGVITRREYLTRIKTKGFWIGTLVVPLFAAATILLPTLLLSKAGARQQLVVVDETGRVGEAFQAEVTRQRAGKGEDGNDRGDSRQRVAEFDIELEPPAADPRVQREALNRRVLEKEVDAWVWIRPGVLNGEKVEYHARSLSNVLTQQVLQRELSEVVRRARLEQAGLDPARIGDLTRRVDLETVRVSREGSRAEGGEGGMILGIVLFLTLYMTLMIWGQQMMTSVLEEKSSRVIEVLLSAIKPTELMWGKLLGVGLAALTQFAIWLATLALVTAPGMLASMALLSEEGALPPVTVEMVIHLTILFVLGFLTYASLYAAIGSAFNNVQEAQQAAGVAVFGLVLPVFFLWPVLNDPNSTLSVGLSLVPLFTPMLMALRVSAEVPPLWQLLLAYALSFTFLAGMVWICARIYRVGILMYGKKPTIQEMWKWVRYS